MTENWLKYEAPKSPRRIPPTQSTYCSGIDLSRPSSARIRRSLLVDLLDRAAELGDRGIAEDDPHQQEDGHGAQEQERQARHEPPKHITQHRTVRCPLSFGQARGGLRSAAPDPTSARDPCFLEVDVSLRVLPGVLNPLRCATMFVWCAITITGAYELKICCIVVDLLPLVQVRIPGAFKASASKVLFFQLHSHEPNCPCLRAYVGFGGIEK